MAGVTGLEPATSAVTGQRSNQLSYTPITGEHLATRMSFVLYPGLQHCRKQLHTTLQWVTSYCYGGR